MKKLFSTPTARVTFGIAILLCVALLTLVAFAGCKKNQDPAASTSVTTAVPDKSQPSLKEDYKEPSFPDTGMYVNYSANSSIAGSIQNGGTHRVDVNSVGTVKAIPNLGYRFVKWSDGSKSDTRTDTLNESTELTAIFEPYIKINYSVTSSSTS